MSIPDPVFFYHAWLGGDWHPATRDTYFTAADAALPGEWYAGLTGVTDEDPLGAAKAYLHHIAPYRVDVIAAEEHGYEQVTLMCLQRACKSMDPETPVLYTHAKGSFSQHAANDRWRRQMTDELIGAWAQCTEKLADGYVRREDLAKSERDIDALGSKHRDLESRVGALEIQGGRSEPVMKAVWEVLKYLAIAGVGAAGGHFLGH